MAVDGGCAEPRPVASDERDAEITGCVIGVQHIQSIDRAAMAVNYRKSVRITAFAIGEAAPVL